MLANKQTLNHYMFNILNIRCKTNSQRKNTHKKNKSKLLLYAKNKQKIT